ncbi:hypothetical protein NPIL_546691 [Nephila pilipes]|uniref:Uncharacterized protein n=1 Tax=Nephila pilipes TaxID=299642 RepID=A0A8X6MES6_NEPPI|nr:hypothetical protein NPIL_546691 [Nephila pilipes]
MERNSNTRWKKENQQLSGSNSERRQGRQSVSRNRKAGLRTATANRRDADSRGRRQGRTHRRQQQQETTPDRTGSSGRPETAGEPTAQAATSPQTPNGEATSSSRWCREGPPDSQEAEFNTRVPHFNSIYARSTSKKPATNEKTLRKNRVVRNVNPSHRNTIRVNV